MDTKAASAARAFIVDDHPLVVEALQLIINSDPHFTVCGSALTGAQAIVSIAQSLPDIVVLDLGLPDVPGQEVIRRVLSASPAIRVLVLTATRSAGALQLAMNAGAHGVVTKAAVGDDFMSALRSVAAGERYVDPVLASAPKSELDVVGSLSGREHSVLRLVAKGMASKQIASELSIGPKTVETHKSRALAKLGLSSRADIFRFAKSQGWLEED